MLQTEPVKKLQAFAENNEQTQGKFTIGDEKVNPLPLSPSAPSDPSVRMDEADAPAAIQRLHATTCEYPQPQSPFAFFSAQTKTVAGSDRAESNGKNGSSGCHGQTAGNEKQHVNNHRSKFPLRYHLGSMTKADDGFSVRFL